MDVTKYNGEAWAHEVEKGNRWTIPVDGATIAKARLGEWSLLLTPTIAVPREWFGDIAGARILCLASGGGQQGPVLAAAGTAVGRTAEVTVFDYCQAQLDKDALVAEREKLAIRLVQGDMRNLSAFPDASFDLIFHPVSNCFVDGIEGVWKECARVLRKGGSLLAGFCNPLVYIFDLKAFDESSELTVRYRVPYSDVAQLPPGELEARMAAREPLEYRHSLDSQIGGQLAAGFSIRGFYEDDWGGYFLDPYIKVFIATRAVKD